MEEEGQEQEEEEGGKGGKGELGLGLRLESYAVWCLGELPW